jgi:membrane protease subunit HflC
MSPKFIASIVALLIVVTVVSNTVFILNETEQAIVLQFGETKQVYQEPGLKFKVPFIQNVVVYDKRVLDLDPPVQQVILSDQKRLDVDSFVRFIIKDPLKFFQAVGNEEVANQRLNTVVNSSLRRVLGNVTLIAVLSEQRVDIMNSIQRRVGEEAQKIGVEIVDVRIRRADLPLETSQAIFARMRSEREREANEFRAEGEEQAQEIRSKADRERTVILAEAEREAQILRGEGDKEALTILAKETSRDPRFYGFYRSLEAYKTSMKADDTTMVLSPDSEFFKYFNQLKGVKTN